MVSVQDVRDELNKLSDEKVADETIQSNIDTATVLVNLWKANDSTSEIINRTILLYAAMQSYISYLAKLERGIGVIPPGATLQLNALIGKYEAARNELIKGNPQASIPVGLITSRYTLGPV